MTEEELLADVPYKVFQGCPTVSFQLSDHKMMLPVHALKSAYFYPEHISLEFSDGHMYVVGKNLDDLWKQFQTHAVRSVSCGSGPLPGDVSIVEIKWAEKPKD